MNTLLTGSSRGIGKAIAQSFLEKGYTVVGTSRKEELPYHHTKYHHIQCDLSVQEELTKLKEIFQGNALPEVLINNAAIFDDADFSLSDTEWLTIWDRTMQVNLRAAAVLTKWVVNAWVEQGIPGRIINIASRAAQRGDTQAYTAYAASKAGLVALTKSIARSFGQQGITAYAIAPGFVDTDMARSSIPVYGEAYLTKDLFLETIVPPEEIAHLVLFLAEGKLKHATGQVFHINSGSYLP